MVLRLPDLLDLLPRERNVMLQVAGFAPAYPHGSVGDPGLAAYAAGIDRLLTAYEPFPALVLDAYSVVVTAIRACGPLFPEGDQVVRTMELTVRFDAALDVTVDALRVELIYPLDAVAERFLRNSAA